MNVVTGKAVAATLQGRWVGRPRQHRSDKAVKANDVKVERIIRQSGEERCAAVGIRGYDKWIRGGIQSLNGRRRSKHSPIRQLYRCRLRLAARSLLGKSDVNCLVRSSVAGVLDLESVGYFRSEKAQVE